MSDETTQDRSIEDQAAQWLVRVHAPDVSDADIEALTDWLDASPDHLAAYERAERVWETPVPEAAPTADVISLHARRSAKPALPVRRVWWLGGAVAACLAGMLTFMVMSAPPKAVIYQTQRGQTLEVALTDGTHLHLNTDTRLSVAISPKARTLVLEQGQVALNVVHDTARPLTLQSGPTLLRDVGTTFDVLRHDNATTVTVAEGAVAILNSATTEAPLAPQQVLRPGDQAIIPDTGKIVTRAQPQTGKGFDWEHGQAVYRDQSLAYVVNDLNRYLDKPLVVDGPAADLRLTAVIALDGEASVVKHLQDYLPVEAKTTQAAIHLGLKP